MIWRYLCINLLIYYHPIVETIADKPQPDVKCTRVPNTHIRTFSSLQEYKANRISFDSYIWRFRGNFVTILNTSDILEEGALEAKTSESIIGLKLTGLLINEIHGGAFASLTCLHYLNLSDNNIVELHPEQWSGLRHLETLDLRNNNIIHLKPFTFRYLKTLLSLDLSLNNIVYIDDFSFNYLISLKRLSLANNYLTYIYQNYIFLHLSNLEHLDLSHNSLSVVSMAKFGRLDALKSLNFSNNNMVVFDLRENGSAFEFPFLKLLNLTGNYLNFTNYENLPKRFTLDNLTIDINGNPVHCYYIEKMLNLFQDKVRLARGLYFGNKTHVNHIRCKNTGMTEEEVKCLDEFYSDLTFHHLLVMLILCLLIGVAFMYVILIYHDFLYDMPHCRSFYAHTGKILPKWG